MSIKLRLLQFIEYLDIPVSKFEKNCGLSNAYLAKMQNNAKWATIKKIKTRYPEINTTWLTDGTGEMLQPKGKSSIVSEENGEYGWKEVEQLKGKVDLLEKQLKECQEELLRIARGV